MRENKRSSVVSRIKDFGRKVIIPSLSSAVFAMSHIGERQKAGKAMPTATESLSFFFIC